jgi:hypothetical protein
MPLLTARVESDAEISVAYCIGGRPPVCPMPGARSIGLLVSEWENPSKPVKTVNRQRLFALLQDGRQ